MKKFQRILILVLAVCLVTSAVLLVACKDKTATLTLDVGNGGTLEETSLSVEVGAKLTDALRDIRPVTEEGVTFVGWYLGDKQISDSDVMPKEGLTLTAKYDATFTVRVYYSDASGRYSSTPSLTTTGTARLGAAYTLDISAYTAKGTADTTKSRISTDALDKGEVFTVYIRISASAAEKVRINYRVNRVDSTATIPSKDALRGEQVVLADGADFGLSADLHFEGWATTPEGNVEYEAGDLYDTATMSGYNITLYARWQSTLTDAFGGDDRLFVSTVHDGVVYLRRLGMEDKQGSYNKVTGNFLFEENDKTMLEGRIEDDLFYYFEKFNGQTFIDGLSTAAEGEAVDELTFGEANTITYTYTPANGGTAVTARGTYTRDVLTGDYIFVSDDNRITFGFDVGYRRNGEDIVWMFYRASGSERGFYVYKSDSYTNVLYLDGMTDDEGIAGAMLYTVQGDSLRATVPAYYYLLDEDTYGFSEPTYMLMNSESEQMLLFRTDESVHDTVGGRQMKGTYLTSDGFDGGYVKYDDMAYVTEYGLQLDGFGRGIYTTYDYEPSEEEDGGYVVQNRKSQSGRYEIQTLPFANLHNAVSGVTYDWSDEWIKFTPDVPHPTSIYFRTVDSYLYPPYFVEIDNPPYTQEWASSPKQTYQGCPCDHAVIYYYLPDEVYILGYYTDEAGNITGYELLDLGYLEQPGDGTLGRFTSAYYDDESAFFEFKIEKEKIVAGVMGSVSLKIEENGFELDQWGELTYDGHTYSFGQWTSTRIESEFDPFYLDIYTFGEHTVIVRADSDGEQTTYTVLPDAQLLPLIMKQVYGQDEFDRMFINGDDAYIALKDMSGEESLVLHGKVEASDDARIFTLTTPEGGYPTVDEFYLEFYSEFVFIEGEYNGESALIARVTEERVTYNIAGGGTLVLDEFGNGVYTPQDGEAIRGEYDYLDSDGFFLAFVSADGKTEKFFRLDIADNEEEVMTDVTDDPEAGPARMFRDGGIYGVLIVFFGDENHTVYDSGEYGTCEPTGKEFDYFFTGSHFVEYQITTASGTTKVAVGVVDYYDDNDELHSQKVFIEEMIHQTNRDYQVQGGGRIVGDGYTVTYRVSGKTYYGKLGIGFVQDQSSNASDYDWRDDWDKGTQLVFMAEYVNEGGQIKASADEYLFDILADGTLSMRDTFNGMYNLYDKGRMTRATAYLDGHGNATLTSTDGTQTHGKYMYLSDSDCFLYTSEDGSETFRFKRGTYSNGVYVYYIYFVMQDEQVYVGEDWSVLVLGEIYEDERYGLVNGTFVDANGISQIGFYIYPTEGLVRFDFVTGETRFYDISQGKYTPNEEEFIVRGGVLYGYNGPRVIEDLSFSDDIVEIADGVFSGLEKIGGGKQGEHDIERKFVLDFNNVKKIGDYAFYGVWGFYFNDIDSEKIEYVGDYAFYCDTFDSNTNYNTAIVNVNLPNATYIGAYAFYGCNQLRNGTVKLNKVTYIGEFAFTQNYSNSGELMTLDLTEADISAIQMDRNAFFPGWNTDNWIENGLPVRIHVKDTEAYLATAGWYEEIRKTIIVDAQTTNGDVVNTVFVSLNSNEFFILADENDQGNYGVTYYSSSVMGFVEDKEFGTYIPEKDGTVYIFHGTEYFRLSAGDTVVRINGDTYYMSGKDTVLKIAQGGTEATLSFRVQVNIYTDETLGKQYDYSLEDITYNGIAVRSYSTDENSITVTYVQEDKVYRVTIDLAARSAVSKEYGIVVASDDGNYRGILELPLSDGYQNLSLESKADDKYTQLFADAGRDSSDPENIHWLVYVQGENVMDIYTVHYYPASGDSPAYIHVEHESHETETLVSGEYRATFGLSEGKAEYLYKFEKFDPQSGKGYSDPPIFDISIPYDIEKVQHSEDNVFVVTLRAIDVKQWTVTYTPGTETGSFTVKESVQTIVWVDTAYENGDKNYYAFSFLVNESGEILDLGREFRVYTYEPWGGYGLFTETIRSEVSREGNTFTFSHGGKTYTVTVTMTPGEDQKPTYSVTATIK